MMKKVILVLIFIGLFSCDDSCGTDVSLGPPSVYFSFLNETTGENIYNDSLYNYAQIQVFDTDSSAVFFNFIEEDSLNQLVVFPPFLNNVNSAFTVKLNDTLFFDFNYDVETVQTECYTNYFIENLNSNSANMVLNNYIYEVKF